MIKIRAVAAMVLVAGVVLAGEPGEVEGWVRDLASDAKDHNAVQAWQELIHVVAPTQVADEAVKTRAVALLEQALGSADQQQRQMAASVLRRASGVTPSEALLRVTVEGLKHDSLPGHYFNGKLQSYTPPQNASEGVPFLVQHIAEARSLVESGLTSYDTQQKLLCAAVVALTGGRDAVARVAPILRDGLTSRREQWRFLAAYLLGCLRVTAAAPDAVPVLVPHLKDNDLPMDQAMSRQALQHFGSAAEPWLKQAAATADPRQHQPVIRAVLGALEARPLAPCVVADSLHCIWSVTGPAEE